MFVFSGRWVGAIVASAGAAFAIVAAMGGARALCVTEGCSLYEDVALAGLSLWWYGAGCLALVAALAAVGRSGAALGLCAAGLVLDCGLIAWLALTAPCLNCLLGGLFFFLATLALSTAAPSSRKNAVWALAALWLFLFSPNLFELGKELAAPWPLRGAPGAPIKLFFSPSCPSCRDAVTDFQSRGDDVAFYPVAEDSADYPKLRTMVHSLAQGKDMVQALADAQKSSPVDTGQSTPLDLRWKILRNRMALARMSVQKIPAILVVGYPKSKPSVAPSTPQGRSTPGASGGSTSGMLAAPPVGQSTRSAPDSPSLFPGQGDFRACPQGKQADCD